jgi:hypothetical protein
VGDDCCKTEDYYNPFVWVMPVSHYFSLSRLDDRLQAMQLHVLWHFLQTMHATLSAYAQGMQSFEGSFDASPTLARYGCQMTCLRIHLI